MLLLVAAVLVVSCLVVGALVFGALRLADTTVAPVPSKVSVQPGYDGPLIGTWQQLRGGFTGVEAAIPSDSPLGDKWPAGSVVELALLDGGRYRLTLVEAMGSGVHATKKLVREEGSWTQQGEALSLTPEKGVRVNRTSADRKEEALPTGTARSYRLETRIAETDGPPGASPVVHETLRLTGPCPGATTTECQWDFEQT